MTEWRDATAFFLTPGADDDEQWLRGLSSRIDLRSEGLIFDEHSSMLNCEWAGLDCRAQLINGPAGKTLVISYFARDFREHVAAGSERWRDFCRLFARACLELDPAVAVALGTISDDVLSDVRDFDSLVAEGDAAGLQDRWHALLYLSPALAQPAELSPAAAPLARLLPNGGRISWDWRYDDFPE
ncbi:hypothetical protein [Micromonospora sp. NPDC005367]|uniref:hypothetical protein n=1 Tax=Micromonospora sp. NPDC005367 TaxID=3155590 RepID=UPI0033B6FF9E